MGLRVDWSFTPRMFLNTFVQYNGETDTWLSNVRYNLIHRPLSDIYVVWNETHSPGIASTSVAAQVHAHDRVLSPGPEGPRRPRRDREASRAC